MKRYILMMAIASAGFASCSNDKAGSDAKDSTEVIAVDTTFTATEPKVAGDCYTYTKNRDTAYLKLNVSGEELTGDLNYSLYEKDRNSGTIAGEIKGDTIIAEYTFDSEGMRSVREVVFLKKDGKLYEGFGDVTEKGGKTLFKNRADLKFTDAMVFSKTECRP
ncbi:hypothetical protein [Pedobacter metabolipauper]|uniref:NlpE-like protein n=1 Tax=Pedobacter metabolipauper TaxID=425513 RepID=A0A4R6STX7_9SPHI|nr:hypothetical protein [Pedobacter metabolipauper]TDQ07524.1 hypothetical protein ATK78_3651 [Pedobacter metabolipauper]